MATKASKGKGEEILKAIVNNIADFLSRGKVGLT